jgi:hypothetical protein
VSVGVVPTAWPLIAAAGPPALIAVILFALNVLFTIGGRPSRSPQTNGRRPLVDRTIAEILEIPGSLDVLVEAGFTPLKIPAMRAALAGTATLSQACGLRGVPLEPLVRRLEELQHRRLSRVADAHA